MGEIVHTSRIKIVREKGPTRGESLGARLGILGFSIIQKPRCQALNLDRSDYDLVHP
jgi:hypothetical protein